jgi:hypothetical protein
MPCHTLVLSDRGAELATESTTRACTRSPHHPVVRTSDLGRACVSEKLARVQIPELKKVISLAPGGRVLTQEGGGLSCVWSGLEPETVSVAKLTGHPLFGPIAWKGAHLRARGVCVCAKDR